jgi:hypothetical protein
MEWAFRLCANVPFRANILCRQAVTHGVALLVSMYILRSLDCEKLRKPPVNMRYARDAQSRAAFCKSCIRSYNQGDYLRLF